MLKEVPLTLPVTKHFTIHYRARNSLINHLFHHDRQCQCTTGILSHCSIYFSLQYFTIQYNTIQYRYDTIRYDTIRFDSIRFDSIRFDTIRYDTIQYNTLPIQYDTIRYDTIRYIEDITWPRGDTKFLFEC